jgi:hypothetical protein
MYKIQERIPFYGWVNLTRAGDTEGEALRVLAGYRRDYPSREHRAVKVTLKRSYLEHYTPINEPPSSQEG